MSFAVSYLSEALPCVSLQIDKRLLSCLWLYSSCPVTFSHIHVFTAYMNTKSLVLVFVTGND